MSTGKYPVLLVTSKKCIRNTAYEFGLMDLMHVHGVDKARLPLAWLRAQYLGYMTSTVTGLLKMIVGVSTTCHAQYT
jgi:hypothetical protein